jgi:serine/threonine protein kinase
MDRVYDLYSNDDPPRGTPNYVSPEEVNGTPSEFSNQHQLAVTMFNIMNDQQKTIWTEDTMDIINKDPSAIADDMREFMHSDDTQYLPKPEWMSEDVHQVFLKATSYIPEERYNSCQEFMEELRKAFDKRT